MLLTHLLFLIVLARLLGALFERYKQPGIVGEMLAGVILGPAVLGLVHADEALHGISELAVFLVVLSAGLEMRFQDVVNSMKGKGLVVALIGFALPFGAGMAVGLVFGLDAMRSVFLALCISITALPVAVRMLESFGYLDTAIARYAISTAIINDVLALLMLGAILNLPPEPTLEGVFVSVGETSLKLLVLAAVVILMSVLLNWMEKRGVNIQAFPERLVERFGPEALFGVVVVFVLAFGSVSAVLGFHFVIGAFFGALLIDRKHFLADRYDDFNRTLGSVTNGFLAPVFFAYLGLELSFQDIDSPFLLVVVLIVSVASKIYSGVWGGRLVGLDRRESLGLGIMLNGRGVMELVVASIAYQKGFIDAGLFSILLIMGVVTTLITPILFRRVMGPPLVPAAPAAVPSTDQDLRP